MEPWETAIGQMTIGLMVVIAIADAIFVLLVGEDGLSHEDPGWPTY